MSRDSRMDVGVNYPWFDYGWDFGIAPPDWRAPGAPPRWTSELGADLQRFHGLGITVVRWFILADGLTYGSGSDSPQPGPGRNEWHFTPPDLSAVVVDHFEQLLATFERFNDQTLRPIQLLPVFIDFQFCQPGVSIDQTNQWVKRGRAEAVADSSKRSTLLDRALDPLLQISQQFGKQLYAWELINEPEWITSGWHPDGRLDHPVDSRSMSSFLAEGNDRIRRAGFKPTIGFARIETLQQSRITAEINQFHHYPNGRARLEPHGFDPRFPAIIGEFATAESDVWPELRQSGQRLLNRLRLAERRRYPLAMAWSFRATDRHTAWTAAVEQDILAFTATEETQSATEGARNATEETQRNTGETQRNTGETQRDTEETQRDTEETQRSTEETQTNIDDPRHGRVGRKSGGPTANKVRRRPKKASAKAKPTRSKRRKTRRAVDGKRKPA